MMKNPNLKSENLKKIIAVVVVLTLFGGSYQYYFGAKKTSYNRALPTCHRALDARSIQSPHQVQGDKVVRGEKKGQSVVEKPAPTAPSTPVAAPAPPAVPEKPTKIKPTDIKDLVANATAAAGKKDPFSSTGSRPGSLPASMMEPRLDNLPTPPPMLPDFQGNIPNIPANIPEAPPEPVVVKGFIGNKVIADIKGVTESLNANESLRGVKVLKVDPANYTCDFIIEGKRVTKRMKPIDEPGKNIEIDYMR